MTVWFCNCTSHNDRSLRIIKIIELLGVVHTFYDPWLWNPEVSYEVVLPIRGMLGLLMSCQYIGPMDVTPQIPMAIQSNAWVYNRPIVWDCGFESRLGYRCLSLVFMVICQVKESATNWTLIQRNPTNNVCVCVSLSVIRYNNNLLPKVST